MLKERYWRSANWGSMEGDLDEDIEEATPVQREINLEISIVILEEVSV